MTERSRWNLAHDLVPRNVALLLHRGLDVVAEVDGPELRILNRVLLIGEAFRHNRLDDRGDLNDASDNTCDLYRRRLITD